VAWVPPSSSRLLPGFNHLPRSFLYFFLLLVGVPLAFSLPLNVSPLPFPQSGAGTFLPQSPHLAVPIPPTLSVRTPRVEGFLPHAHSCPASKPLEATFYAFFFCYLGRSRSFSEEYYLPCFPKWEVLSLFDDSVDFPTGVYDSSLPPFSEV